MRRCGALIGTLMTIVLAGQGQAAPVATPIQGFLGKAENTCVAPIAQFLTLNCQFSGGPMFAADLGPADLGPDASIGPLDSGGFYTSAAAAPGYTLSDVPGNEYCAPAPCTGRPFTSFLVGLPTVPGDGKFEIPITGTIVIDDLGDGFGANDTVAGTIELGEGTRVASGSGSAAGSATITESWTSITHTLEATVVSSATANGDGGFDYVLGSDGFPTNIFTGVDAFASEAAADSDDVPANSPWRQANGGSGFNYDSVTDSGTDIVSFGLKNTGPGKNIGGNTMAGIDGLVCSDVGLGPTEADSMGNEVIDTMTDCQDSSVAWGVRDPVGTDEGKLNAGFDNLVLKLSTNANGTVLSANAYYTMEYPIIEDRDNTWVGGTLALDKAPPVANDDSDCCLENSNVVEVNIPVLLDVLNNDEKLQSTPLTVVIDTDPQFGKATPVDTGGGTRDDIRVNYAYTAKTVNATDSFTYSIMDATSNPNDERGDSNTATVTVQVENKIPEAMEDFADCLIPGTSTNIAVLDNDTLGDLPTQTVTVVPGTGPTLGTATVNQSDFTITYTSTAGTGVDSFEYELTDYNSDTSDPPAKVTVTVSPVGIPCAANDGSPAVPFATVAKGGSGDLAVLANDSGLQDVPLEVDLTISPPANGTLTQSGCTAQLTCLVTYTNNGTAGIDSFDYKVTDVDFQSDIATVTVLVSAQPIAVDDGSVVAPFATVTKGGSAALAVLANDLELDDEPLKVTVLPGDGPSNGMVTTADCDAQSTCLVTYINDGMVGIDSFVYTVTDNDDDSDTATVTVVVNDQPMAAPDEGTVEPSMSVNIPVLLNDSGLSDVPLSIMTTNPSNGSVIVENDNTVTYLNNGTVGIDTFNYTVTDNDGGASTAVVTVTVADPNIPMAANDTVNTNRGKATTIDVLDNDGGLEDTPITVELYSPASHGDVIINGSPASILSEIEVIYLPDDDFLGLDTFDYRVSDDNGDSDTATVTINVLDDEIVITLPSGNNSSAISPWSLVILTGLLWLRQRRRGIESA